jgi:TetR/AcrR family transcriptional repressor of mexJK operon
MKDWAVDHPKAKLMARKRAAILAAAKDIFLASGYEGASMEAIAAAADVSIMTLYRHAESKDDLFAAIIASACDPNGEAEQAEHHRLMRMPLPETLAGVGLVAQQRLADPQTVSLLRAVMAEVARFPGLAETAYQSFVGHQEQWVAFILASKDESRHLDDAERQRLAHLFIDRLFGSDILRVLLGLAGVTPSQQRERAERARDEVMRQIELALA